MPLEGVSRSSITSSFIVHLGNSPHSAFPLFPRLPSPRSGHHLLGRNNSTWPSWGSSLESPSLLPGVSVATIIRPLAMESAGVRSPSQFPTVTFSISSSLLGIDSVGRDEAFRSARRDGAARDIFAPRSCALPLKRNEQFKQLRTTPHAVGRLVFFFHGGDPHNLLPILLFVCFVYHFTPFLDKKTPRAGWQHRHLLQPIPALASSAFSRPPPPPSGTLDEESKTYLG